MSSPAPYKVVTTKEAEGTKRTVKIQYDRKKKLFTGAHGCELDYVEFVEAEPDQRRKQLALLLNVYTTEINNETLQKLTTDMIGLAFEGSLIKNRDIDLKKTVCASTATARTTDLENPRKKASAVIQQAMMGSVTAKRAREILGWKSDPEEESLEDSFTRRYFTGESQPVKCVRYGCNALVTGTYCSRCGVLKNKMGGIEHATRLPVRKALAPILGPVKVFINQDKTLFWSVFYFVCVALYASLICAIRGSPSGFDWIVLALLALYCLRYALKK